MGCGVGHRCGSDSKLLWLWCRPAATAPSAPSLGTSLRQGAALKSKKKGGGIFFSKMIVKKQYFFIYLSCEKDWATFCTVSNVCLSLSLDWTLVSLAQDAFYSTIGLCHSTFQEQFKYWGEQTLKNLWFPKETVWVWGGNTIKLDGDDHCTTINVINSLSNKINE